MKTNNFFKMSNFQLQNSKSSSKIGRQYFNDVDKQPLEIKKQNLQFQNRPNKEKLYYQLNSKKFKANQSQVKRAQSCKNLQKNQKSNILQNYKFNQQKQQQVQNQDCSSLQKSQQNQPSQVQSIHTLLNQQPQAQSFKSGDKTYNQQKDYNDKSIITVEFQNQPEVSKQETIQQQLQSLLKNNTNIDVKQIQNVDYIAHQLKKCECYNCLCNQCVCKYKQQQNKKFFNNNKPQYHNVKDVNKLETKLDYTVQGITKEQIQHNTTYNIDFLGQKYKENIKKYQNKQQKSYIQVSKSNYQSSFPWWRQQQLEKFQNLEQLNIQKSVKFEGKTCYKDNFDNISIKKTQNPKRETQKEQQNIQKTYESAI